MPGTLRDRPLRTRYPDAAPQAALPPRPPRDEPDAPLRWRWLGLGCALALVSTAVLPGYFFWFLCALPHEMGHATVGCLLGRPAAPAISLGGHAWTGIADRQTVLVVLVALVAAASAVLAFRRQRTGLAVAAAAAAIALPIVAFTGLSEVLISLGGHVGELLFAGYCYALVFTGGKTGTPQERTACAFAGSLVQAVNVKMCFLLMTSPAARSHYGSSGSLGMKNDYLVLAEDLLHCKLETVSAGMLLLAIAVPLVGVGIGIFCDSAEDDAA